MCLKFETKAVLSLHPFKSDWRWQTLLSGLQIWVTWLVQNPDYASAIQVLFLTYSGILGFNYLILGFNSRHRSIRSHLIANWVQLIHAMQSQSVAGSTVSLPPSLIASSGTSAPLLPFVQDQGLSLFWYSGTRSLAGLGQPQARAVICQDMALLWPLFWGTWPVDVIIIIVPLAILWRFKSLSTTTTRHNSINFRNHFILYKNRRPVCYCQLISMVQGLKLIYWWKSR